jgi:hypothetical protein
VTAEILNLGYSGRNINPQGSLTIPPAVPSLPGSQINSQGPTVHTGVSTVGCGDPSSIAVIRLARVRDNPSFWSAGNHCGLWPKGTAGQHGTDYWPNVLYDTREGLLRDNPLSGTQLPLAGAMHYVELDVVVLPNGSPGSPARLAPTARTF